MLREGERIGGRYVLERRLGLGGMGEVWLAEMLGANAFRRRVVLKVLAPERRGDPRVASMLADEARLVALLHHPGIVSALDYLETEEHGPVFVLEFVDGASLHTALRLARRQNLLLPEAVASYIGVQVAYALDAAHKACGLDGEPLHVVHRDVSSDNVLISRMGGVYLGDFGVARAAGHEDLSHPGGGPKGKRGYMAPEQAAGEKVGPAADVFALGRVVAEAADVQCGTALRAVIDKATAQRPRDRFHTAGDLATALVKSCPPPPDAQTALATWLASVAPEFLGHRRSTAPGVSQRSEPPAGRPTNVTPTRLEPAGALFAAVPPPPRRGLKIAAGFGALLVLLLPIALLLAAPQGPGRALINAITAAHRAHGDLRLTSRPSGAEVYIDGQLRGVTPLLVELQSGKHTLRVGTPRLEHWKAMDVFVRDNVEHRLEVDLTQ